MKISEIIKGKKGSIKQAQIPVSSPSWEELSEMIWEKIERGAEDNISGFRMVPKLLSDRRFDR
ncbi:MAG: hypothetical protein WBA89_03175 [Microcoleus sp.]